jgi:hypothetical protein
MFGVLYFSQKYIRKDILNCGHFIQIQNSSFSKVIQILDEETHLSLPLYSIWNIFIESVIILMKFDIAANWDSNSYKISRNIHV